MIAAATMVANATTLMASTMATPRWLGRIADREGDEAQAQRCYREAAQFP